jgi:basic amino acid/polyamine antiporter, APA family
MSSTVSARPPGGPPPEPALTSAKDEQKARALGLTSATGLVIGTVIGTGVFTMPAVLAFFVTKANFGAFNASGGSLYSAIGIAAGVALFSFIGVETAAITAKRVKDPRRNVGRASLLGTGASAIVYLVVSAAVMGLVSHHALVNNGAPFVNAFQTIFPHGAWAGKLVAALAAVSGFGALIGWTLVTAEVSRAPANDGLFPRPFAWTDRRDNAWFGIVAAAALPSLLMLWRYTTSSRLTVFTYLVNLTVVTVAIPYLFSACAQLTYLVSRRRPVQGWQLARDLSITIAATLFSLWVTFAAAAGQEPEMGDAAGR